MDGFIVRRIAGVATLVLVGAAAYFCFWPVPVEPVSWPAPTPLGYAGAFAPNTRLSDLRTIDTGREVGPEHIAIAADGTLYAAMASGNLLRMRPDGGEQGVFANTGGRVLGFDFDGQGRMIAADAVKGLLAITAERRVTVLADHVTPDDPIGYADAVIVAPDGTIYLTDASRRFLPVRWGGTYEASVLDIIEQSATGRVLAHDPATGHTRIVVVNWKTDRLVSSTRRGSNVTAAIIGVGTLLSVCALLVLSGLPAPYVGGLLTTSTMTSKAGFGGDTDPPGYTQASIATIRLWKSK